MSKGGYPSRKDILKGVFTSTERRELSPEFNHEDAGIVIKALVMHVKKLRGHIVLCEDRIKRQKYKLNELDEFIKNRTKEE